MEVEGLKRALNFLKKKVNISKVVTDASTTVISCLGTVCTLYVCNVFSPSIMVHIGFAATEFPEYHHSLDVWHKSKKLKKSLAEVSSLDAMVMCVFTLTFLI